MVRAGDEIYFTVDGKPATGKVLCHGKHGCTVRDSFGQTRKLKYQHVLGHKTRVDATARVVDQGVDGAILEDEDGRRRYLHGYQPEPVPADPVVSGGAWGDLQLAKAMTAPVMEYVRDLHGQLLRRPVESPPMPAPQEMDTGPLLAAVAGMIQALQAEFSQRMDALAAQVALLSGQKNGSEEIGLAVAAVLEEARRPMPPIELNMTMTLPDKKPVAMRGTRDKDGAIVMVPIEP